MASSKLWRSSAGEEYSVVDHKTRAKWSNLPGNFIVGEWTGEMDWFAHSDHLMRLYNDSSVTGGFCHIAWTPSSVPVINHALGLGRANNNGRSVHAPFGGACNLHTVLRCWRETGGPDSGEWLLAGFRQVSTLPISEGHLCDLSQILGACSSTIGFILSLTEMRQSAIFAYETATSRMILQDLARLGAASS